jgi:hypothetical protein
MKNKRLYFGIGIFFICVATVNYQMPWRRFAREPPSFHTALARTCKQLLEQEDFFDTNHVPAETRLVVPYPRKVTLESRNVNFTDRLFRYSPNEVTVSRNRVHILCYRGRLGFGVGVEFFPFRGNRWEVRMSVVEGGVYLLWEGESGDLEKKGD